MRFILTLQIFTAVDGRDLSMKLFRMYFAVGVKALVLVSREDFNWNKGGSQARSSYVLLDPSYDMIATRLTFSGLGAFCCLAATIQKKGPITQHQGRNYPLWEEELVRDRPVVRTVQPAYRDCIT